MKLNKTEPSSITHIQVAIFIRSNWPFPVGAATHSANREDYIAREGAPRCSLKIVKSSG